MTILYANNVAGVTAADVGPTDTIVILSAGQGAQFPSLAPTDYFWVTLIHPASFDVEIAKCTSRTADTLTLERGRDGTQAIAFPAGTVLEMRLTAEMMREVNYRAVLDKAGGVPSLDADARLSVNRLPTNAVVTTGGKIPAEAVPDSFATDQEVDTKVSNAISTRVAKAGDAMTGQLSHYFGDVGTTVIYRSIGRGDGKQRYNEAVNADGSYVIYAYDAGGGAALPALTLKNVRVGGSSSLTIDGIGEVWGKNTFDPATKVNVDNSQLRSPVAYRYGFGLSEGIVNFGNTGAHIWYNGTNFSTTNVWYGPNFVGVSDATLKKGVRNHKTARGFADHIELMSWEWRRKLMPNSPVGRHTGPLAQAVREFAPHHVSDIGDGKLGVDKAGLALEGVVDLAARLQQQEEAVAMLTAAVAKLTKNK